MATWTFSPESSSSDTIDQAMWEYVTEIGWRVLGRRPTETEVRTFLDETPPDEFAPPRGVFLAARTAEGELLGCVGVRLPAHLPKAAEIKRMYVLPAGRAGGLGRALLRAAETAAGELGATRMVLETNTALTEARALYAADGYAETEPYDDGHGAAEHWYAKNLASAGRRRHSG